MSDPAASPGPFADPTDSGAQARIALSLVEPPPPADAARLTSRGGATSMRPRRRWYDRIPVWRWLSVLGAIAVGGLLSVRMVGTHLVTFLVVTTAFVLLPPACVVAVVTLLISAWRSTSWRRRVACALLALVPALLLYKCATTYDQVMNTFFAGPR